MNWDITYPQALWLPHPSDIILGILAIYAAFALRFVLQFCLAILTFWFERASSLDQLMMVPYLFLSGLVIPIAEFPPALAAFARLTPFPYLIDFPARLLTGNITLASPELYQGFAMMLLWFLALSALASLLWKRGLRHYSGQGA